MNLSIHKLTQLLGSLFRSVNLSEQHVQVMTDFYLNATLRDVGHHDITNILGRLQAVKSGKINHNPNIQRVQKHEAFEVYDGDNGLGELCSFFILDRACELADRYSIGICSIRNSNHFNAAYPYIEKAADNGYLAFIYSKAGLDMPAPGYHRRIIGNAPCGFGAPTHNDADFIADFCLAYASFGKLRQLADENQTMPPHWGQDKHGRPSGDPKQIFDGGSPLPIGGHKGFSLAIIAEILTAVLADAAVIDEGVEERELKSTGSQTAIVISTEKIYGPDFLRTRVTDVLNRLKTLEPGLTLPGEHSHSKKKNMIQEDSITLDDDLMKQLYGWLEMP